MVVLKLTDALEKKLNAMLQSLPAELCDELTRHLDATTAERTIPHDTLVKASRWYRDSKHEDRRQYTLATLLKLTDIHIVPLAPRTKSPELLATLAALQLSSDRASYARMTSLTTSPYVSLLPLTDIHDPAHTGEREKTVAEEWKDVRREVGAILNVLASAAAVGTGVWWVGGGRSYAARLVLAMLGAVAIAAIEAFLYWRFFTRETRAPLKGGQAGRRREEPLPILSFDDLVEEQKKLSETS